MNLKRVENVWEVFSSFVNKCSTWVRDFAWSNYAAFEFDLLKMIVLIIITKFNWNPRDSQSPVLTFVVYRNRNAFISWYWFWGRTPNLLFFLIDHLPNNTIHTIYCLHLSIHNTYDTYIVHTNNHNVPSYEDYFPYSYYSN